MTKNKRTFTELNWRKFEPYEDDEHENDIDRRHAVRVFSGRMTKLRWQILSRFTRARSNYSFGGCGHVYDCCGCLCGQNLSLSYKNNQVKIIISQSFNY